MGKSQAGGQDKEEGAESPHGDVTQVSSFEGKGDQHARQRDKDRGKAFSLAERSELAQRNELIFKEQFKWKGRDQTGFKEGKQDTVEAEHKDSLPETSGKEKNKNQCGS